MNVRTNEQMIGSPAEVYDEFFVPALFEQWGRSLRPRQGKDRATACSTWPAGRAR